jgi:Phage ABA sandwich domain
MDKMTNDRKLDQWIAENIFNIELQRSIEGNPWMEVVSEFTSDMNEAVKILKKLQLSNEESIYSLWYDYSWFVEDINLSGEVHQIAHNDSPTMAICLAAYKIETGKDWL